MNGKRLHALFESHGGVSSIEVRPVFGGWANTSVCADGFRYTTTAREDRMLIAYLKTLNTETCN